MSFFKKILKCCMFIPYLHGVIPLAAMSFAAITRHSTTILGFRVSGDIAFAFVITRKINNFVFFNVDF